MITVRVEDSLRIATALEALVVVETQRLEVEKGILQALTTDNTAVYARLILGVPVAQ